MNATRGDPEGLACGVACSGAGGVHTETPTLAGPSYRTHAVQDALLAQ